MKEGEVLAVCDFAENYSLVVQDEIQSFHWNNNMVTIHPLKAYYKVGDKLEHLNFVVISECNTHDTSSTFVSEAFPPIPANQASRYKRMIFISDRCAGKNSI